jgi:hypothetical protein
VIAMEACPEDALDDLGWGAGGDVERGGGVPQTISIRIRLPGSSWTG